EGQGQRPAGRPGGHRFQLGNVDAGGPVRAGPPRVEPGTSGYFGAPMPRKPLDDLQHGLRVITERLRVGGGDGGSDWIADQLDLLRKPPPPRSMAELQAELHALVGLDTVT